MWSQEWWKFINLSQNEGFSENSKLGVSELILFPIGLMHMPIENTDEFKEKVFENIKNEIARYDTFDGFTNLGDYPIIAYPLLSHSDGWCTPAK